MVHPVPTPVLMKPLRRSKDREGGSNQKLILFMRG